MKDKSLDAGTSGRAAVRTLTKGLAVLDLIVREGIVRTGDVAARLSLDKGGTSRLLQTLAGAGYAERTEGRGYRAGPRLEALRGASGGSIRRRARPILDALSRTAGECAYLGVAIDDSVLYLDKADIAAPLKVDHPIGTLAPLDRTALGKVLLAYGCAPIPAALKREDGPELARLERELERIVRLGHAVDDEERAPGVRCVAAPLRGADGVVVAAVAVAGPASRMPRDGLDDLGRTITATVAHLFEASPDDDTIAGADRIGE